MSELQRVGRLEVGQDLDFQRREWLVERVGWAAMALLILAGLLGLLGGGPLARATAGDRGGPVWLEYDRFERYRSPATLRLHLSARQWPEGRARVRLSREYLEGVQVERVVPEPESIEAGPDWFTYVLRVTDPTRPPAVTFDVKPERLWRLEGRIGLADGPELRFGQLVYP